MQADVARSDLKQEYGAAKIFWHAAGLNEDVERPELAEHFGIVTAEAMAAGCVPVVINRGAQPEIVDHGVSGFVWNNIEELIGYTALLAENEALRTVMSDAARARARTFAKEDSVSRLSSFLMKT